jgi:biopolymer transport protein ExbD
MGIYKENKFSFLLKNKKPIIITIISILLVVIIILIINSVNWNQLFTTNPISTKFEENPLDISKKNNTIMSITIKNNTNLDVNNSKITINPVEDIFTVFCEDGISPKFNEIIIPKIAKGNTRTVYCNIRYDNSKDIFEGSYSFDVSYLINNTQYTKRNKLNIKK